MKQKSNRKNREENQVGKKGRLKLKGKKCTYIIYPLQLFSLNENIKYQNTVDNELKWKKGKN